MTDTYLEINLSKHIVQITYDNYALNPRKEWDHDSIFVCREHRNYILGDEQDDELLQSMIDNKDDYIMLYVYMYDHSGVSFSASRHPDNPYSCRWDSGLAGVIAMEKYKVKEIWKVKRIGKTVREKVYKLLEAEIEEYNDYVNGNVFGFMVIDKKTESIKDSCCGFYGDDFIKNGLYEYVDGLNKSEYKQLKKELKNL